MIFRIVDFITTQLLPAFRPQKASAPVFLEADSPPGESWFTFFLRRIVSFCYTAVLKALLYNLQSIIVHVCQQLVVTQLQRFVGQWNAGPPAIEATIEAPCDLVPVEQAPPARTKSPKKAPSSWTYMRGVALALGELCKDDQYGANRIPLSAILDLMRQHQSDFVPLGPHVERDVPKRLIELVNDGVVFYDPIQEHVVVREVTRQKYALRRQELLAKGVDPANLSVFGVALTKGLFKSARVTNAGVVSYKEDFLLTQGQMGNKSGATLTRHESLMSIADAACPARLMPDVEVVEPEGSTPINAIVRRDHSVRTAADVDGSITSRLPDSSQKGTAPQGLADPRGPSILSEITAIIDKRDSLEAKQDRLRTTLETSD